MIGDDFEDLEMVLRSLKFSSLTSNRYIVLLVCGQVSKTCTSNVRHIISSAKIVVVSYFKHYMKNIT